MPRLHHWPGRVPLWRKTGAQGTTEQKHRSSAFQPYYPHSYITAANANHNVPFPYVTAVVRQRGIVSPNSGARQQMQGHDMSC